MKKRHILLGVTGSIAAYKACELVRLLVRQGHTLSVVMTRAATEFVRPLTFQTLSNSPVYLDQFAPPAAWKPEHIALAQAADLALVAPATANMLAKLRMGLADDLLSSVLLATRSPIAVAPAMNDGMWANPATQENIAVLKARGVRIIGPVTGDLACGSQGAGRMLEPVEILKELNLK